MGEYKLDLVSGSPMVVEGCPRVGEDQLADDGVQRGVGTETQGQRNRGLEATPGHPNSQQPLRLLRDHLPTVRAGHIPLTDHPADGEDRATILGPHPEEVVAITQVVAVGLMPTQATGLMSGLVQHSPTSMSEC